MKINNIDKKQKKVRLDNTRQLRRFVVKLINEVYNGELPESKARSLSTICNTFIRIFEVSEIEKRLIDIESILKDKR